MTRVLVTGGRTWGEVTIPRGSPPEEIAAAKATAAMQTQQVFAALDALQASPQGPITLVIHGAAKGADACAQSWAYLRHVKDKPFRADWQKYKKAAGPIRNLRMIEEGKPDLALAFPGGPGTADCLRQLQEHKINIVAPVGI